MHTQEDQGYHKDADVTQTVDIGYLSDLRVRDYVMIVSFLRSGMGFLAQGWVGPNPAQCPLTAAAFDPALPKGTGGGDETNGRSKDFWNCLETMSVLEKCNAA